MTNVTNVVIIGIRYHYEKFVSSFNLDDVVQLNTKDKY